ncbi:hypothetical protein JMJ77_0010880 [Colletotrichum scovillei]|uniref:Uncharacterized protein n=1 Tax=Colletotrichum scovillei TaxID=1209932 RepID=A0A9P7UAR8_9PEZI|nr:hypothetical protein JMJ77_0010880 [Colletotrichum scovillei]KAG7059849.1 hypothetical protein JMJ78_0015135 [Colletotrichum scovillei]KAG7067296.1 hypothetical protein JMJ76_0008736 [Colletotrichum scovillei]
MLGLYCLEKLKETKRFLILATKAGSIANTERLSWYFLLLVCYSRLNKNAMLLWSWPVLRDDHRPTLSISSRQKSLAIRCTS